MRYSESLESKNLISLNSLYYLRKYKPYIKGYKFIQFFYDRYLSTKKLFFDISNHIYNMLPTDLFYVVFSNKFYRMKKNFDPKNSEYEINYTCSNKYKKYKIVIYTSVFGKYDSIKEPYYNNPNIDYVAITDVDLPKNSIWKKYNYSKLKNFKELDSYHKSKFCKMFPNLLFPNYDISIWVDGNIQIVGDLYPLVDRVSNDKTMAMFEHPINNDIFEEKDSIVYFEKVRKEDINKQIQNYINNGFPRGFGMKECSIIIRKHNDLKCIKIMNDWWEQVNTYTMRDQISLPYSLWKNNEKIDYIQSLGDNWRWNVRVLECEHIK